MSSKTTPKDDDAPTKPGDTEVSKDKNLDARARLENLTKRFKETQKAYNKAFSEFCKELKSVGVQIDREKKNASKNRKKSKPRGPKAKKSGLEIPVLLHDVMCDFMGIDHGSKAPRTEAKAYIRRYIRENKLQDPDNGRRIIPDKKLKSILHGWKDGDDLTYWSMETYIKQNFMKSL